MSAPNGGGLVTEIPPEVALELHVERLESDLRTLTWLLAEKSQQQISIANTVAALLAQQVQPQVQQAILKQILSG